MALILSSLLKTSLTMPANSVRLKKEAYEKAWIHWFLLRDEKNASRSFKRWVECVYESHKEKFEK